MTKNRDVLYTMLFLVFVLFLWFSLSLLPGPAVVPLPAVAGGEYHLAGYDFENTVYVTGSSWVSWPEKLYAPEDLYKAEDPVPHDSLDYTKIQFATHQLRLTLPNEGLYAISMYSPDYSMRLYIDGVLTDTVGHPGTTREETVPQMRDAVYTFKPQNESVEVVVQAANFVHRIGSRAPDLTFGTAENLTKYTRNANLKIGIIFGCLITACLYHLSIFLLNRRRKASLVFSVLCLLLAYLSKDFFALLFPVYNWQITLRMEYIACVLATITFILLIRVLFPTTLHKKALWACVGVSGFFILVILFTDTTVSSGMLRWFQAAAAGGILYGIVRLALLLKEKKLKNLLAFLGVSALGSAVIADVLSESQSTSSAIGFAGFISTGMMFLIFCYALLVAIEGAEADQKLEEISRSEKEIREANQMLERVDKMKDDLIATVSHESRTPLAVLSGYAELVSMELRRKGVDEQTAADLDQIAEEAQRIAKIIEEIQDISQAKYEAASKAWVQPADIIRQTARMYAPILKRKKTELTLHLPENLPLVYANPGELTQVFFNLLANARNHTENGEVVVSIALREAHTLAVRVADTGCGIPPELLPHVFERYRHGEEGGTGLGLSICKDILEGHGGGITIESEVGKGTVVSFTLPLEKKEGQLYGEPENSTTGGGQPETE